MPNDTFFNLSNEKKERIINTALDEFASNSFHQSKVTAIARNADIAMGSFYQYFEDKKDLYKFILGQSVNKKLKYINQDMLKNKEKYNFFELLRETYLSGIRFARENPRLVAIGNQLLNNEQLKKEIWKDQEDKSSDFFLNLIKDGQKKGELDPHIDPALISKLLTGLNKSLSDIIYKEGQIKPDKLEDEMKVIDQMIYFIKNGLDNKN